VSRWLAVGAAALLGGCSTIGGWFSSDSVVEPPAPLVDFQPSVEVRTLWDLDIGAGSDDQAIALRPAVQGGRLAIADARGRVQMLDAQTGSRVWEGNVRVPVSAGPSLGAGLAVVGTTTGEVMALDAQDGTLRWQTRVSSEVLSPPAIARGVVAVRTGDGRLFGLDAASGRRLWVFDRPVPVLSLRGTGAPVIAGDAVVAGFDGGRLAAVTLLEGRPLWEARLGEARGRSDLDRVTDVDAAPVVVDEAVYGVASRGFVAAFELASGKPFWQREMASTAGLAVDGRALYVVDERSHVYALDRFSGRGVWRQTQLQARGLTAPTIVGRYVVVGDREGYLHWLRREDGELAARYRVDSAGFYSAPEAASGVLYAYGRGGTVEALRAGD
jgi:outer membrane protein assembly factor BamB